jgi:hypothetical protein
VYAPNIVADVDVTAISRARLRRKQMNNATLCELVMLAFDLYVQHRLMVISFASCLL